MTAVFVTATGTEVGKTFVTAGLIRALHRQGRAVDALKPVVSGFDPNAPGGSDPALILDALDRPMTQDELTGISPWHFRAPLSPDMAARAEGRHLVFEEILRFCGEAIASADGALLIEGVGGIMVPLDDRHTVLDWMAALDLPLILVTGSYLGTISHTLSALDVLARRGLTVRALVVSESAGSSVSLGDTEATLANFVSESELLCLPRLERADGRHPVFDRLAELLLE